MFATTALCLVVLAVAPAMAQRSGGRGAGPGAGPFGHDGPGQPGHGPEVMRLVMHRLDLSASQRDAIRDLLHERRAEVDPETLEAHRAARHAMVRLLWSPDATPEGIDAQAAALAEFDRARAARQFETTRRVLAELTPEQVAELQILIEDPPERHRGPGAGLRHGRHGGSGS
jgi:Spy/CpxP family protein refolding chaperone